METREKEMQEGVNKLFRAINCFDDEWMVEEFYKNLIYQHRTLQQNFFRMLHSVIIKYGDARSDLRNEASVEFCRRISETEEFKTSYFPTV